VQLFINALLRRGGELLALKPGPEHIGIGRAIIFGETQLLLDHLELLAQENSRCCEVIFSLT
jgi:hypothetical protein